MNDKDLFPRFSEAEFARRYSTIRKAMKKDNVDALLISGARGSSEVNYLSNYLAQSPCWLLFPREGEGTVFIHFFNHQPCAKAQSVIEDVRWYGPTPMPTLIACTPPTMAPLGVRTVASLVPPNSISKSA